jgi:hypothetical protein
MIEYFRPADNGPVHFVIDRLRNCRADAHRGRARCPLRAQAAAPVAAAAEARGPAVVAPALVCLGIAAVILFGR